MSRPSLLAFFAHPDDEAFSCAGTLARAASRGIEIGVITATRGEAGRARDGRPPAGLAARRTDELVASCRVLGAGPPRFLDLANGKLEAMRAELGAGLRAILGELRPDAVITMGPDGAYGHRDHVACTEALDEAVAAAADPPTVLHTAFPPGLFEHLVPRLARAGIRLVPPAGPALVADYVVDIRAFRQHRLASIAAHRSQLVDGDPRSFLMPGFVDRLLDEERFRHARGPDLRGELAALFTAA